MRTVARLIKALLWITVFVILFGGIATGLVVLVGWPLPDHWPTAGEWLAWFTSEGPISHRTLIDGFACAMWLLWGLALGYLTVATVREIRLPRLQISVRRQGVVSGLVGAIVLGASRAAAAHTGGDALTPPPDATGTATPTPAADTDPAGRAAYTVRPGDTLWDIAADHTGNPMTYQQIAADNQGRIEPDGRRFSDPDLIYPGWTLEIPNEEQPAAPPPQHPPAEHATPHDPSSSPPGATPSTPSLSHPPGRSDHPAGPRETDSAHRPHDPSGHAAGKVVLPSGSWIGAGLAGAIAATAAAAALHRRRRRRPRWPSPPTTSPTPNGTPNSLTPATQPSCHKQEPGVDQNATPGTQATGLVPDARSPSAAIGLDTTGADIGLEAAATTGLALSGPGAMAAARGILAAALSAGTLQTPDHRISVVTTTDLLTSLLPAGVAPAGLDPHHRLLDGERLLLHPTTEAALTAFEQESLYRHRIASDYDPDDPEQAAEGRAMVAAMGLTLLLLDTHDDRHTARAAAVLATACPLRLGAVLLTHTTTHGPTTTPHGLPTVMVAADGTTTSTTADITRMATLDAVELADLLDLVRAGSATITHQPHHTDEAPNHHIEPTPQAGTRTGGAPPSEERETPPPPRGGTTTPPVQLRVLGPPAVTTPAGPVPGIRATGQAILAYLAVHLHGVTRDHALDDLYPGVDTETASSRFRTACTAARTALRAATGRTQETFILYTGGRYQLDPDTFDIDLWTMQTALHDANHAASDEHALTALRRAADAYRGPFGESLDQPWIADYATTFRNQAIDVQARIAEILETDQPDAALAALDTAISYDPVCEELYQRAMRIHGRLGRTDAVRRTLDRCTQALDAIQAEPSETTQRTAARQLQQPSVT